MKTKTYFIIALIFSLSLVVITQQACKKENDPPPPDNEEPSIPETTKVISNNDWNENIIAIDSTNWTLTFKKELSQNNPVSVGDIVVNANGQGLLRKISEIKEEGGNLIISTTEATIVEALPKGRVEFNIDLTHNFKDAKILYMAEGVELMSGKKDGKDRIDLIFSLDQELADHVTISGKLSIAPSISGTVVWEGRYPDTVIMKFTVDEEVKISAAVNIEILKLDKEIKLIEVSLPTITIPAAIPIVITPVLQLVLGANIDVKSEVTTGLHQKLNFIAGFEYVNNNFSTNCDLNKDLSPIPPKLSNTLKATAYVKPKIEMKLYQVVSPILSMTLYEELEAELDTNPWWTLYAGLSGDVGFKIGKWGFDIVDINANLFNHKVPIDSAMTADFTANITSGTAPLTVYFTDQSTKDPTSWQWDFGDGSTSTQQNPSYTYNTDGSYTVTLTATNGDGSNVKTKPNYIVVSEGGGDTPIADFTADITSGEAPLTVYFTDQSENDPTTWQWDFGDDGTSTQQNPSHTYNTDGSYTVTLTATNEFGSDVETKTNYIVVSPGDIPIAEFTATPTTGNAPLTVSFTDQSENDPTCWQWGFGDGSTSTQQNPSHTYNTDGSYTVTLTATNGNGTNVKTKPNYIVVSEGGGDTFTDPRDGQTYNIVDIGSQTWFAENLNYQTGNSWCYLDDPANCNVYGRLYTWNDALTACPSGWHLPSYDEWTILSDYLGGILVAGGKMKETGTEHWNSPNTGATNSSGFTGLPGGYRYPIGYFDDLGFRGMSWSATEVGSTEARYRNLGYVHEALGHGNYYKEGGLSVRCLKD